MIDYDALAQQNGGNIEATTQTKVYSGIIAQGILQPAQSFTPQPKQVIESIDDLQQVLHDNLALYIADLPGKLHYEVSIVPRVVLPSGDVAVATRQQVVKGTTKAGKPEYKWVTNKYAKVTIYAVTDKGRREKIDEIVLGATDAVAFQPTAADLASLATGVQENVATQDIHEADTIVHAADATLTNNPPPAAQTAPVVPSQTFTVYDSQPKGTNIVPRTSTTYADAQTNLIPWRFFKGPDPNGAPVTQLYVMVSPNVLYNTEELTLTEAVALIRSYDKSEIVIPPSSTTLTGDEFRWQKPGSTELNGKKFLVVQIGKQDFPNGIDDLINGKLPPSNYVWAYQPQRGSLMTFVPLSQIPLTP